MSSRKQMKVLGSSGETDPVEGPAGELNEGKRSW